MCNLVIVIPTFNRKLYLKELLNQIKKYTNKRLTFEVVVVVDGSTDGTVEMLNKEFPEVHIDRGTGDWWYTKSMNEGFKYAINNLNPDYILTLNDDVILANDYFVQLKKYLSQDFSDTIIGSMGYTYEKPYRIVTSGNTWKNKCLGTYHQYIPFLKEINPHELSELYETVTLPGRGMLIPVSILKELNYFDEKFMQYHSDGDFTLRALEKGYMVKISYDLKIKVRLNDTSASTSFLNKSVKSAFKSFANPVSRNYIPSMLRFIWRHGHKLCSPLQFFIFISLVIYKTVKNKLVNVN